MNPAAWHPDPLGRYPLRWWDGTQWTQNVSTGSDSSIDPVPIADGPSGASAATPAYTPPAVSAEASAWGAAAQQTWGTGAQMGTPQVPYAYATSPKPQYAAGPTKANRPGASLAMLGGIAVIIGSTMEWASFSFGESSFAFNGTDSGKDGMLTLVLGSAILAMALWQLVARAHVAAKVLAIIAAALSALIGIYDFMDISRLGILDVGIGLYVVIAGSALGLIGGIAMKSRPPELTCS